ncbi:transglycosylase [Corynebacterium sp. HMSC056F09]|uniref:FtsX-like permease family protein n=1 Tax=Corynebacterium TaxID=1716 RepID=UPI0008A18305|nr:MULTISPECIES: FtsX-like permease family protein [Corynebacterium]MBE7338999.1 FtsX-like permease family protein [Corynebacterium aurimucosum]OFL60690.1 transglycosylase [Corynebacterium sp. HMSC065D07]OFO20881.1 transglycosylase [Corynebacterium sp. HMSC056F09]OFQ94423.1 transglycosylase [Corynebacterium sp. HMSC056E09]
MLVWLKDLQSNWLSWLAVALTLVVSSTSCTLALAMLVASPGAEENPAGQLGGTVLGMSLCVVVLVTLSQMRLIIAEREPVYRSWRMVGMPGWVILFFILGQVAVVSAGAGLLGVLPALPLLAPCVRALRSDGIPLPDIAITGQVVVIAVVVCMSAALVGALPPLRRVFRPRAATHPAWLMVKFLLASVAVGSTVYGCLHIDDPGDLLSAEMGLVILVALFLPWLMPGIDQWTRAVGIAGNNVRVRRSFSTPHIVPWVLVAGLIVAVGSGLRFGNDVGTGGSLSSWQVFVALLGPVFAPSIVGAVLTSLLMHGRIAADIRGLTLAGAAPSAWARVQVGEAACLTLTAAGVVWALCLATLLPLQHLLTPQASFGRTLVEELWWPSFAVIFGAMFIALGVVKLALAGFVHTRAASFAEGERVSGPQR